MKDPSGLFNSSLDGNVRRAIDIHEGDKIDEAALKDLIRAGVALNLKGKNKAKPKPKLSAKIPTREFLEWGTRTGTTNLQLINDVSLATT